MGLQLAFRNKTGPIVFFLKEVYVSTHRPAYICMYKIQTAQMQNAAIKRHCLRKLPSVPWCWGLSKRTRGSRNSFQEFQRLGRLIPGPARDRESDCPESQRRPRLAQATAVHNPPQPVPFHQVWAGTCARTRLSAKGAAPGGASRGRPRTTRPSAPTPALNSEPPPTPKYWRESSQAWDPNRLGLTDRKLQPVLI